MIRFIDRAGLFHYHGNMTNKAVSKVYPSKSAYGSYRTLLIGTKDTTQMRAVIEDGIVRGSALRKMRLTLDLTIDDIADILGVSHRTLVRKEQGKTTLSPSEADRGVSPRAALPTSPWNSSATDIKLSLGCERPMPTSAARHRCACSTPKSEQILSLNLSIA